jgi:hypothetical protein
MILALGTATQDQGLVEGILEMPMMGFDGTVLMGLSWIVTARLEAIVVTESLIPEGDVLSLFPAQILEGRR